MTQLELAKALEKGDITTFSKLLEEAFKVLLKETCRPDTHLTETIKEEIQNIQILINRGAHYQELQELMVQLAKSAASVFILQTHELNITINTKTLFGTPYHQFILYLKEMRARLFLEHRFGIDQKTTLNGYSFSAEDLHYANAILEMKHSFKRFIESNEHYTKVLNLLTNAFKPVLKSTSNLELQFKAEKEAAKVIQFMNADIASLCTPEYFNSISDKLKNKDFFIIPILTLYIASSHLDLATSTHAEAVALLNSDKLFKLNRSGLTKIPNITIYKTQKYAKEAMELLIKELLTSFETPRDHKIWEKSINDLTKPEKIKTILKREQFVGNCAWATSKLFIYSEVFAIIFQFLKDQKLKDFEAMRLVSPIADALYKQFTTADRNNAVSDYLSSHGMIITEPSNVQDRIQNIKAFLKKISLEEAIPADKELLTSICIKSLNKLLADHLKKGDIGAAQELFKTESRLVEGWNPLFYAALSGKLAIAELLANNPVYVNAREPQNNNTPLHLAAAHGHLKICKIFVLHQKKNYLNLKAVNYNGNTALHLAALNGKTEIASYLLKHDPELLPIKNVAGDTALKLAHDTESQEMVKLLQSLLGSNLDSGLNQ